MPKSKKNLPDLSLVEKVCPDCALEGHPAPQPVDNFYVLNSPRYAGGVRISAYCKMHTVKRNSEKAKAKRTIEKKPMTEEQRAKRRARHERYKAAHPERLKEQNRRNYTIWRGRHPEEAAERVRAWQKANPEKNRAKANRWWRKTHGVTADLAETSDATMESWKLPKPKRIIRKNP